MMATPSYHIAVTVPIEGQAATALEQAFAADELLATADAVIGHPDTNELELDFEHVRTAWHSRTALRALHAVDRAVGGAELPPVRWVRVKVEPDHSVRTSPRGSPVVSTTRSQ
jgi:hypothetical protein